MKDLIKFGKKLFTVSVVAMTILWSVGLAALMPTTVSAETECPELQPGDLFKVTGNSAVYLVNDDMERMYFPTADVYYSWYEDFSGVREIPPVCSDNYPVGGAVNYRAGAQLVKTVISPTVYVVLPGGELKKLANEEVAAALYGSNWNTKIVDLPDVFFSTYTVVDGEIDEATPQEGMLVKKEGEDTVYVVKDGKYYAIDGELYSTVEGDVQTLAEDVFNALETADETITFSSLVADPSQSEAVTSEESEEEGEEEEEVAGSLTVSLAADTPESSAVVVDAVANNAQAYIEFLKINLTASDEGDVVVNTLKFKRAGLPSADTDISNVQLYDGDEKLADYSSFTDAIVTFNNLNLTVPAGETKTLTLVADIADDANSSRSIKFVMSSEDYIDSDADSIAGSFPIEGNTMSTVDIGNNELATATIATVSNGSGNEPGTTDQELWTFRITGANKKITVSKVRLTMVGTVDNDDLQNLKLYQGSTQLGDTVAQLNDDRTVTFTFDPFEINKTSKDFVLKGDIVGGVGRNYKFSIQSMDDLVIYDSENNIRIKPGAADNWTIVQAAASTTISEGSLTVSKTLNTASGDIVGGADDQVVAAFDFKATGEPIKITNIYLEANTDDAGGLDDVKIYVDGAQVGSTQDLSEDTATPFSLGNSLIIPAGETKTVEIHADMYQADGSDLTDGNNVVVYLSSVNGGGADGNAASYQKTISMTTGTVGAVSGYTRTVRTGQITTSANGSVSNWSSSNPTSVVGATNVLIGSFLVTIGAGENVKLDTIKLVDTDANIFDYIQNLKVKVNGTEVGTTVSSPSNGTTYTFNISPNIEIEAAGTAVIEVYADTKSTAATANGRHVSLSYVSGVGVDTGNSVNDSNERDGQNVYFANSASLSVSLDGDTPASTMVVMGDGQFELAKYNFEETSGAEDVTLTKLVVTVNNASDLVNYALYDGSTQIGSTVPAASGSTVTFNNLSVSIPASGSKTLTVKAEPNTYGNATAGDSIYAQLASGTTAVTAEGAVSGPMTVTLSSAITGNTFKIYRTKLTVVKNSETGDGSSTEQVRSTNDEVASLTFAADSAYNAKFRGSVQFVDEVDWDAATANIGVDGTHKIDGSNSIKVSANGTYTTTTPSYDGNNYSYISFWYYVNDDATTNDTITIDIQDDDASLLSSAINPATEGQWVYVKQSVNDGDASSTALKIVVGGMSDANDAVYIDNIRLFNDSITVDISGDLNATAPLGTKFELKDASNNVKFVGYYSGDTSSGSVELIPNDDNTSGGTGADISVGSSGTTYKLYTSTSALMHAEVGSNESLNLNIDLGNSGSNGDIYWYDGALSSGSVTWALGETPVTYSYVY